MDHADRLLPGLRTGERVSIRGAEDGVPTDVIGFVTAVDDARIAIVDRRGITHDLGRETLVAGKRVDPARGRNPLATPPDLLAGLVARAGAPDGSWWVARLSDLLAGVDAPADVPAWGETAAFDGLRARFEGEWVVVVPDGTARLEAVRAACWWATRMGARSACLVLDEPDAALRAAGFAPFPRH
ncbi:hypothetical protein [Nigerium massiliense]|uniref:hypothetical protein n=1 Tax=Nigerium massiliense TaxID=1522317 RepID=UPI00058DDD23|nr:hypothetical protein [Nigerium massiliense]